MLLPLLHGLFTSRKQISINNSYKNLVADVFEAPVGKSYGSYSLDDDSNLILVKTINLPDFVGSFLRKVQLDFLIERFTTNQGDFIIVTVQPVFHPDLGEPIISEHYINSLKGRKFINYLTDGSWTFWKELNCEVKYLASFTSEYKEDKIINIDPQTITEYFIKIGKDSVIFLSNPDKSRFVKPVHIDLVPSHESYSVVWPDNITWSTPNGAPPSSLRLGERLCVKFELSFDDVLIATYSSYRVD